MNPIVSTLRRDLLAIALFASLAGINQASGQVLLPIPGVSATSPANLTADQAAGVGNPDLHAGASTVVGASDSLADGNSYPGNTYYSPGDTITFNLGAHYDVTNLLVWNNTQNDFQNLGAQSVSILSSTNGSSYTPVTTTTFNEVGYGSTNNSFGTASAQILSVTIPDAKYIELVLNSNYGSSTYGTTYAPLDAPAYGNTTTIGINQVRFVGTEITEVPEPSTYALMLAGLAVLAFCVRRKNALAK